MAIALDLLRISHQRDDLCLPCRSFNEGRCRADKSPDFIRAGAEARPYNDANLSHLRG